VSERKGRSLTIAYDDGDRATVPEEEVATIDVEEGSRVYGRHGGVRLYFPGTVTHRDGERIHIIYDAGREEDTTVSMVRVQRESPLGAPWLSQPPDEERIGPRWGQRFRRAGVSLLCAAGCVLGIGLLILLATWAGSGALCYLAVGASALLGLATLNFGLSVLSYVLRGRGVDLGSQVTFSCPHCHQGWGMFLPGEGEVEHCPSCNKLVRG
jgi:hypothetical protein